MSKKFTEEQYQKIVEIQKGQYSNDLYSEPRPGNKSVEHVVEKNNQELNNFIDKNDLGNQAIALMNPLTREWAHEQFVEEEKKYYWKLNGLYLIKDRYDGSIIFDSYKNLFTESEIREWGYNPEMFDKEEVD